jgi:putative phosphoesterase
MRIALISDQHANDVAFRAVVADIERIGVDRIVCLGDVAQGGPQPAEVLDRLASLGCETIIGNSDAFLIGRPDAFEEATEDHFAVRGWTLDQLDDRHLEQIRSFEATVRLEVDGQAILCFHGSPNSYNDVLLPEGETDIAAWRADADVLAGGHTHRQWARRIDGALFVNPGSVGITYDHHHPSEDEVELKPIAEYAIVYVEDGGAAVDFRRVAYPLAELRDVILASGRPRADQFAADYRDHPC